MKKFFKKIINALSYIVLPRKMGRLTGMSSFIGVLLFVVLIFFSTASSGWTVGKYVEKSIGDRYYLTMTEDYKKVSGTDKLPKLEYLQDAAGKYYYATTKDFEKDSKGNDIHIYDVVYKNEKLEKTVNAKFVYELEYLEVQSSEEQDKISKDFVGTYILIIDEEKVIVDVATNGNAYIAGEQLDCTEKGNTLTCKNADKELVFEKIGSKYKITLKEGKKITVFEDITKTVNSATLKYFDFDKYMHEKEGYTEGEDDILVIYTRNIIYYMYNRGYTNQKINDDEYWNFLIMQDKNGKIQNDIYDYFLPDGSIEATLEPNKWTKAAKRGESVEIGGETFTAYNKVTTSLAKVFSYNVPLISYNYFMTTNNYVDLGSTEPTKILTEFDNFHVKSWGDSINYSTSCKKALPFGFLLPLVGILITWLMSRKKGNLKTFKEYLNLYALSFIPISILEFILGFFIQYTIFIYFAVALQLGFYIFAAYRINTEDRPLETNEVKENPNKTLNFESTPKTEEMEDDDPASLVG